MHLRRIRAPLSAAIGTGLALLLVACSGPGATPTAPSTVVSASSSARSLSWQIVLPKGDSSSLEQIQPLTDYLSASLGIPVDAQVFSDYASAVDALNSGRPQAGFLPALALERAVSGAGATPILQSVRNGSVTYHAQYMTNAAGAATLCADQPTPGGPNGYLYCNQTGSATQGPAGLAALRNLPRGSTVAFTDASSAAGYIFPMLDLLGSTGYQVDDIQRSYAGGFDAAVLAVYNGQVQVAAGFSDARIAIARDKPDVGQRVIVFAITREIPNDGIAVSTGVDTQLRAKISAAILDFLKTDTGKQVMGKLYSVSDLAPADPSSLAIVREARDQVVGR
jgi:phosphonate transport system substrate-binding protein